MRRPPPRPDFASPTGAAPPNTGAGYSPPTPENEAEALALAATIRARLVSEHVAIAEKSADTEERQLYMDMALVHAPKALEMSLLVARATLYDAIGMPAEAQADRDEVADLPFDAEQAYYQAEGSLSAGKYEEALDQLSEALTAWAREYDALVKDPVDQAELQSARWNYARALYLRMLIRYTSGEFAQLREDSEPLLSLPPTSYHAQAYYLRALVAYEIEHNIELALSFIDESIRIQEHYDSKKTAPREWRALILLIAKRDERASADLKILASEDKETPLRLAACYLQAQARQRLRDSPGALQNYQMALNLLKSAKAFHWNSADLFLRPKASSYLRPHVKKIFEKAEVEAHLQSSKDLGFHWNSIDLRLALAGLHFAIRADTARAVCEHAQAVIESTDPIYIGDLSAAQISSFFYMRVESYVKLERYEKALQECLEWKKYQPDNHLAKSSHEYLLTKVNPDLKPVALPTPRDLLNKAVTRSRAADRKFECLRSMIVPRQDAGAAARAGADLMAARDELVAALADEERIRASIYAAAALESRAILGGVAAQTRMANPQLPAVLADRASPLKAAPASVLVRGSALFSSAAAGAGREPERGGVAREMTETMGRMQKLLARGRSRF